MFSAPPVPTLELRIADCYAYLDDAVAIAVLYRCLVRALRRRLEINAGGLVVDWLIATTRAA